MKPIQTPLRQILVAEHRIYIKDETSQVGGSFKFRGPARYFSETTGLKTIVTASTGNHAIGVSTAATAAGAKAEIFLPFTTPNAKRLAIEAAGGVLHFVEGTYEDALLAAVAHADATGAAFLPSYDHPTIIAGNRDIFSEAVGQAECDFSDVFVPVGGGGCVSGAIEELGPKTTITASEYAPFTRIESLALHQSGDMIATGYAPEPSTEGIAIKTLGKLNRSIIRNAANVRIGQANLAELTAACRLLFSTTGIRAELGACVGLAVAMNRIAMGQLDAGGQTLCIITGGNIDPDYHKMICEGL